MSVGTCSVTCGGGTKKTVLERTCIRPRFGGKECRGDKRKTQSIQCNTQSCPGITAFQHMLRCNRNTLGNIVVAASSSEMCNTTMTNG